MYCGLVTELLLHGEMLISLHPPCWVEKFLDDFKFRFFLQTFFFLCSSGFPRTCSLLLLLLSIFFPPLIARPVWSMELNEYTLVPAFRSLPDWKPLSECSLVRTVFCGRSSHNKDKRTRALFVSSELSQPRKKVHGHKFGPVVCVLQFEHSQRQEC